MIVTSPELKSPHVLWTICYTTFQSGVGQVWIVDRFAWTVTVHFSENESRVVSEAEATARVELATGAWVDRWRALPGATQVAFVDPRTPAQQARFAQLRTEVITLLRARGMDDLVTKVDDNLFGAAIDPRIYDDNDLQPRFGEMLELGVPIAVFIATPGTHL